MLRGLIKFWIYFGDCEPGITYEVEEVINHANQLPEENKDTMKKDKAPQSG